LNCIPQQILRYISIYWKMRTLCCWQRPSLTLSVQYSSLNQSHLSDSSKRIEGLYGPWCRFFYLKAIEKYIILYSLYLICLIKFFNKKRNLITNVQRLLHFFHCDRTKLRFGKKLMVTSDCTSEFLRLRLDCDQIFNVWIFWLTITNFLMYSATRWLDIKCFLDLFSNVNRMQLYHKQFSYAVKGATKATHFSRNWRKQLIRSSLKS